MRDFRISICEKELSDGAVIFSAANSRYVLRVLRLKAGDCVKVLDGRVERMVRLTHCSRQEVCGLIVESLGQAPCPKLDLTLGFCCVRPGPMSEILRHGTEVGVTRFAPILSHRANRRPTERKERWESVVATACAQSGRVVRPEILSPLSLEEYLSLNSENSAKIILSPAEEARPVLEILDTYTAPLDEIQLLVGPEGGFEPSEEVRALSAGFLRAGLGPGVLRTETAAVVAAGITVAWSQWRGLVARAGFGM